MISLLRSNHEHWQRNTRLHGSRIAFDGHTSLTLELLEACDTWSYCMVMLLNPVLQFPYQVEIEELHPTTYEMYKREVVNLLTSKQLPTFSDKFGRFQATTWLMLEQVFEKCADFDSTNKIKASYLVETFDHTLIRRSSLQKHITC